MSSPLDDLITTAVDQGDTRLLHAAARAGVALPSAAAPLLTATVPTMTVHTATDHHEAVVAVADQHSLDSDGPVPPVRPWTPYHRRVLACLLALSTNDGEPYPGAAVLADQVLRAATRSDGSRTHAMKALEVLAMHRLISIDGDLVRPGPALAAWVSTVDRTELQDALERVLL